MTTTGYDALSRVTSVTDPLGNVTATTYNGRGDRLTTTAADGGVITNTYTPAGRLATVTDPTGDVTTYDYDGAGRQITMTDPLGGVTTTGLNADGEQVSVTSPAGLVTAYAYDAAGRNTTVTAPDGGITTSSYDAVGRVNTVTDPTGGVVDYDYDPAGRLTASTDPLGNTVTYGYDARGNRTGRTSPTGGTETWTYDLADRMTNAFDQLGNRTRVTFDDAGRVKRTFDPSGRNWRYVYDPNGRVDRVVYGDGTKVVYRWDVAGRVTRIIDDVAGTTKYSYDPVGRPLRRDDPDGTVFRQVYDAAGRVVRQFAPDGTKTVNRYDANGRIDRVVDPDFGNSGFVYDADGRLLRENLPGADDDRVYDYTDGRLTRFKQGADVTRMTYDPAGRVATVRGAQRWDYSYDAAGQLTSATRDGSDDFAYGYDAAGNRTTVDEPGSSADWAYAFDLANQVTERTPLAGGAVESTFTHDEAGRLTDWDSSAGVDNVYGYDVRGRLATTAETDGATVTTTTRTYRDENRLATIAIQVDSDPAETTTLRWDLDPIAQLTELTDPGSTAHRFTPGPAGRLAATASAGTAAFHYDWQGSAIATTATADLVPATSYDPYGQPDQIAASPGLGYRGELTAPDGLTHLRARDHEPELGRFTTRDPLDGIAGTTVETNTHHYANNDPINLIDPSGLRPGDSQFGCRNPHDDGSSIWSAIRRNTTGRFTTGSCALMQDSWFQASETFLYGGFVDPLAAVMASLHAALTDRGALLRGWDNLTQSWSRAWDRHGLTLLWRIPVKGVEQGVVDPARACGGSAQTREQQLTGCGQSAATIIGIAGVGSRAAANGSRGTTGTQKAGANAPTSAPNGPARFIDAGGTIIDRSSIRTTISSQRQGRHVLGDRNYSGGSYFSSADDAQRVLDDFHSGSAEILGIKGNDIVLRTDSVTGFNHNPGAGFPNQPTNVFFINGSSSPSVVPYNPTWGS